MVWDIERGQSYEIEPIPWQTDTCIGDWHYDRRIYDRKGYKSAKTVIQTLVDVVSKNGNLLLSVPLRGDGSLDSQETEILAEISKWMAVNKSSVFGTRPWKILGEGPALDNVQPLKAQGFNEGKSKPFSSADIRFGQKDKIIFATILGAITSDKVLIKTFSTSKYSNKVKKVTLPGDSNPLNFTHNETGLVIEVPERLRGAYATVFQIV